MKMIAGVALAAVMACGLGGIQRAEAAIYSLSADGPNIQDGYFSLILHSTSRLGIGIFDLTYSVENQLGTGYDTYSIEDMNANVDASEYNKLGASGYSFHVHNSNYVPYSYDYTLQVYNYGSGNEFALIENRFVQNIPSFGNVTLTGDPLSVVPLPASAPLFAASLLTLGGIGYASRRVRVTTAQ